MRDRPAKQHETFRLDPIDRERLRAIAKQKNIKRTQLVRQVIVRFLDQQEIAKNKTA